MCCVVFRLLLELVVTCFEHGTPTVNDVVVPSRVIGIRDVFLPNIFFQKRLKDHPVLKRLASHRVVGRRGNRSGVVSDIGNLPPLRDEPTNRIGRNLRDVLSHPPCRRVGSALEFMGDYILATRLFRDWMTSCFWYWIGHDYLQLPLRVASIEELS